MSFKSFLREQEEAAIAQIEMEKNNRIVDALKTIEDLNSDKFKTFAVSELGMSPEEADTVVYKMLRSYLLKDDGIDIEEPIDIGEVDVDIDNLEDYEQIESFKESM